MAGDKSRRAFISVVFLYLLTPGPSLLQGAMAADVGVEKNGALIAAGRTIYRDGRLADGRYLQATVQNDVPLVGDQLACEDCHRRSGLGSSESDIVIPPVTSTALFSPRQIVRRELYQKRKTGRGLRPAYDEQTLVRAITEGIDAAGRVLDPYMPRYRLDALASRQMVAYLKTLSNEVAEGVTQDEIHLATVIAGDVPVAQQSALLSVLEEIVREKNGQTRAEVRRARHGPWYKDWHYSPYRKWRLHVWRVTGPATSWGRQLQELYGKQPVFSVLSGIAAGAWNPVAEFCQETGIACLFPITELPGRQDTNYYNVYFSKGMSLQGEALADYLGSGAASASHKVIQLYSDDERSRVAAESFEARIMHKYKHLEMESVRLPADRVKADITRREVLENGVHQLVVWEAASNWESLAPGITTGAIYFSPTFDDSWTDEIPAAWQDKVYFIYPYALPEYRQRVMHRFELWARLRNIDITDEQIQADAYFATTMFGRTVQHLGSNFSREYLIERLEHGLDNAVFSSVYPHVSLGPGQRHAVNGAYIVKVANNQPALVDVSGWIVP